MCQQGPSEIYHCARDEKEAIRQRYEKHKSGDVTLSDFEMQAMAVRMVMLGDQLG